MKKLLMLLFLFPLLTSAQRFNNKSSVGTIKEGTNLLKLKKAMDLKVGDWITVVIGGEKGRGKRGTPGVGGQWPNKIYPSLEAMQKDTTQPAGTWAGVVGMKNGIFRYNNEWWNASHGVFDAIVPHSLNAKIIKITSSGKYIYLDRQAEATATNAVVRFDNSRSLVEFIIKNPSKTFDARKLKFKKTDTLWFSGRVKWEGQTWVPELKDFFYPTNIKILGGGMTFASTPGTCPLSIGVEYGNGEPNFLVRDVTIVQNGTYEGLGVPRQETTGIPGLPKANEPFGNFWLYTPAWGGWSRGAVAKKVKVVNPNAYAFEMGHHVDSCEVEYTEEGIKQYNGWAYHSMGGKITNSTFKSPYLMRAFEIQQGTGGEISNCTSYNGLFAANATNGSLFKNNTLYLTENCAETNPAMLGNPAFDINVRLSGSGKGVTIDGFKLVYLGYLTKDKTLLRDFTIQGENILLKDVMIDKPPVFTEWGYGNGYGAVIQSGADFLTIDNLQTNARFGRGYGCEQGRDNAQIDLRGKGNVIRNSRFQFVIAPKDAVVEKVETACPVKYH